MHLSRTEVSRRQQRTEATSRAVRIVWVSAVMIHHFLSFYNSIPAFKRGKRG